MWKELEAHGPPYKHRKLRDKGVEVSNKKGVRVGLHPLVTRGEGGRARGGGVWVH